MVRARRAARRVPADRGRQDDGVDVRRGRPEAPVTEDAAPLDRDHRVGPAERDGRTPGEVPAVQAATTVSGRGGVAVCPTAGGALQLPVPGAELVVHQRVEPVVAQLELAEAAQPARHQVGQ